MGLCAGCNLDGRNLAESFETFSQLKKERHTKERQTDTTHTHTHKLMQELQLVAAYIYTYLCTQDLL
jgi:hypothetical protein